MTLSVYVKKQEASLWHAQIHTTHQFYARQRTSNFSSTTTKVNYFHHNDDNDQWRNQEFMLGVLMFPSPPLPSP